MNNKSFSLIELLVVIIIVGVLAGVIIISTSSAIGKTKLAKAQAFYSNSSKELVTKIIAEWSFDEDVSPYTTAKDTVSGNNGAVSGAIYKDSSSKECLSGGCFSFNDNAYIDCGGTNKLDIQDDLSIFVWVKVSSDIGTVRIGNIIGNYQHTPNFNFEALSYGKTRVYWNNGERDISSTDFDMRD
ncbi:MAG: prepilin-type N-terminal cleavage/methylation domain-containing protein, partial [Candidatus Pacebacteria bacterium]|nr:prepilin-type N-terminal cleavage/methylation domain-containing protein [Candidatus Paceibacterota bacterium]